MGWEGVASFRTTVRLRPKRVGGMNSKKCGGGGGLEKKKKSNVRHKKRLTGYKKTLRIGNCEIGEE